MVDERFLKLLTKKLSNEIDDSELSEFNILVGNDEDYRQHYTLFKDYWVKNQEQYSNSDLMFRQIRSKIDIQPGPGNSTETGVYNLTKQSRKNIILFLRGVAAMLIIGLCCYGLYSYSRYSTNKYALANLNSKITPSRVKSKMYLSDGTVVTLNSETTLNYPRSFKGQTREVYLNGEAFFDVAKDHQHPFIVHAGKMSIKVLGTAFNVKSYKNDVASETTLIRGAIEVTLADRPADRIILKPNEKLILKNSTFKTHVANRRMVGKAADTANTSYALTNLTYLRSNDTTVVETSWVNNKLIFKDEDFTEIANKMERWYGVKIKFNNTAVKNYHFTGVFDNETVMQALNALQMIEPFKYKYKKETIYIN